MDWKGARHSVLITGGGQPPTSTIAGNYDPLCMQGLVQSMQLPRRHGEVETPTSNQPPRGAQGRRLLGPAALRPCPFTSLHGQVRARLGPGGYCRRSGNGGPQTCLPAACGVAQRGPGTAHLHQHKTQDHREGPSLAGRTTWSFLRHGLIRLAHEEAERSRRGTSRGAHDASPDDQGRQSGASPHSVLLSSLVQGEQAQARASSKGTRFGATRPRPVQRQGGSHCGSQDSVTTRAFGRRGPTLVRISVPYVPLQNGQLLAPFPLNIWEEAQGLCL